MKIDDGDWHSTITVGPNITPKLGGTLSIYFSDEIGNLESLVGTTFDLFDWGQALDPANRFSEIYVPYPTSWDLSRLYDTGEVTLLTVPEPGTCVTLIVGVAVCAFLASWRRRTRC